MSSYEYDEACIQAFLEQQLKLFPEEVAETPEEAEAFLEDCMAMVCDNKDEVIEYLEDEMDIVGMEEEEILGGGGSLCHRRRTISGSRRIVV